MYITLAEYTALYEAVDAKIFNRLVYDAGRAIDRLTTGIDGVRKLKAAFPADDENAEAVKHCAGRVVNLLYQIHEAEQSASLGRGYTQTENGLQGKVLSSLSSGNESASYSSGGMKTAIDAAIADTAARNRLVNDIIRECLSGVTDANGVYLLCMGAYPLRLEG